MTNNHPILTGMIVLAHMKETLDYYERLDVPEVEGDFLKAVLSRNLNKIDTKYRKLIKAQAVLNKVVSCQRYSVISKEPSQLRNLRFLPAVEMTFLD